MITPIVARLVRDPFDRDGWLFELQWDGFRDQWQGWLIEGRNAGHWLLCV
jgi:ATP-dependent DNA ligase